MCVSCYRTRSAPVIRLMMWAVLTAVCVSCVLGTPAICRVAAKKALPGASYQGCCACRVLCASKALQQHPPHRPCGIVWWAALVCFVHGYESWLRMVFEPVCCAAAHWLCVAVTTVCGANCVAF